MSGKKVKIRKAASRKAARAEKPKKKTAKGKVSPSDIEAFRKPVEGARQNSMPPGRRRRPSRS